jgi:hypothetical protein
MRPTEEDNLVGGTRGLDSGGASSSAMRLFDRSETWTTSEVLLESLLDVRLTLLAEETLTCPSKRGVRSLAWLVSMMGQDECSDNV